MDDTKSILFISYHYPPDSQIGARRIARLAEYIAGNGWKVGVLTVKEHCYEKLDNSLKPIGISVHRTKMFESARFFLSGIKNAVAGRKTDCKETVDRISEPEKEKDKPKDDLSPSRKSGIITRIKNIVLSIVWFPDDRQGWIPYGIFSLHKLARHFRILYSSGPPHSSHLIPLFAIPFINKTRWVAEFRDPWYSNPQPYYFSNRFTRWLDKVIESMVVKKCDMLISVTEAMNKDFKSRYPEYAAKMRCYSNGFDRTANPDFASIEKDASSKLRFFHAGSFDYGRNPLPFLTAIAELRDEGSVNETHLEVVFYGHCSVDGIRIDDAIQKLKLGNIARCMGYIPWKKCIMEMYLSDVLLLFNIDQPTQVPAKLYEYLSVGKNILSITTGGITDNIIARTRAGKNVNPRDIPGLKRAILEFLAERRYLGDKKEINKFDLNVIFSDLLVDLQGKSEKKKF